MQRSLPRIQHAGTACVSGYPALRDDRLPVF